MNRVFCDKCKEEITDAMNNRGKTFFRPSDKTYQIEVVVDIPHNDICPRCLIELVTRVMHERFKFH